MRIENRRASRRENLRLALGFCIDCGEPREGEGATATRCALHAAEVRRAALSRKERLVREGRCTRCGQLRGAGSSLTVCAGCREKVRGESLSYARRRREARLCSWCGSPAGRFSLCLTHRRLQSERRKGARAAEKMAPLLSP